MLATLRSWFVLCAAALMSATSAPVLAQTNEPGRGELVAAVTDSTGAPVGDAVVTTRIGASH